nr:hypothetical protein CFP56_43655 [Quercus suber]
MISQNFTLVLYYNGVLHHSIKKRKYIGDKVKVYDNVDSDCFSVPEVNNYCVELGVLDYVQFYYLMPGLDLDNGLRYLSTDVNVENRDVDEVDVEDRVGALANDGFEEGGNIVDEGNGVRGKDGNGAVGDVDYECGSDYASSDQLHSPNNSDSEQKKKFPEFRSEYLKDPEFVLGMSFRDNKQFKE